MKLRTSLAAAGAAVVLGTTGALVLPSVASAHSSTQTLKFTSVTKNTVSFTKTTSARQDTDVNAKGKTIGFDELYFTVNSTSNAVGVHGTVDVSGGLIYGTLTSTTTSAVATGKVTGGTGAFRGATGTIKAKTTSSGKTAVTITYSG